MHSVETMAWKNFLVEMAQKRHSLVLIGKPGVGKTTCLREISRILSDDRSLNVVVVDKTCEIAGDGDAPHAAIGKARWMPVGKPNMQHTIMREAIENMSPDVIIVDEISTPQEVEAARTIAQRGVQLIATVHGKTLPEVIMCKEERGSLVGGVASVTLSGQEAERRFDKRKQVSKRLRDPVFNAALELHSRSKWIFHQSVKDAVDCYFEGEPSDAQLLSPGKATAVASIPGEGVFEYCVECGGVQGTCPLHQGGHFDATSNSGIPGSSPADSTYHTSSTYTTTSSPYSSTTSSRPPPKMSSHIPVQSPLQSTTYSNGGGFSYSAKKGRSKRWRAPRGSGRCHRCNEHGHYARDCPNR